MAQEFKVNVLYPTGKPMDLDYYKTQHLPLVSRLLKPAGMTELSFFCPTEDDPDAPFQLIAELRFSSREAGLAALGEHGQETQADIPNFTEATPVIVMGDLSAS